MNAIMTSTHIIIRIPTTYLEYQRLALAKELDKLTAKVGHSFCGCTYEFEDTVVPDGADRLTVISDRNEQANLMLATELMLASNAADPDLVI